MEDSLPFTFIPLKVIDGACTQVLRAMFESGMVESEATEIVIRDVSFSGFHSLLQFIYSGTADITGAIAHDVFAVANLVSSPSALSCSPTDLQRDVLGCSMGCWN